MNKRTTKKRQSKADADLQAYADQLADALRKAVRIGLDSVEVIESDLPDVQEEDEADGIANSTRGKLLTLLKVIR